MILIYADGNGFSIPQIKRSEVGIRIADLRRNKYAILGFPAGIPDFLGVTMENKIFLFPIDLSIRIRYSIYSTPAGPLPKGMLTSAGFSFYKGGRT